jgi:hypothetical protein
MVRGLTLDDITIILLLFADDMGLLGKSPVELQHSFDMLHEYCDKWGLEVNSNKRKAVVFRKRRQLNVNEKWTYKGSSKTVQLSRYCF